MFAAMVAVVILLREVLLPFVAGMVLAYLLNPLASRIERLGINRLLATLVIVAVAVIMITALMILTLPTLIHELSYFIESFPLYLNRLHTLATDPTRPWLSKIIGEGLGEAERSVGELKNLTGDWFGTFLHSVWSGGQALISLLSLGVVAPIVACYLLYDWDKMLAAIDNWVPPTRRETVRALAREVDDNHRWIRARAESSLSRPHGVLCGRAVPDRPQARGLDRPCSRADKLHPLSRFTFWYRHFDVCGDRTILAGLDFGLARGGHFHLRAVVVGLCIGTLPGRPARAFEPCMGDVRSVCFWLFVWICGPADRSTGRSRHRCAYALRAATVLCEPVLFTVRGRLGPAVFSRLDPIVRRPSDLGCNPVAGPRTSS
jgi:hypothetical protein